MTELICGVSLFGIVFFAYSWLVDEHIKECEKKAHTKNETEKFAKLLKEHKIN